MRYLILLLLLALSCSLPEPNIKTCSLKSIVPLGRYDYMEISMDVPCDASALDTYVDRAKMEQGG